MKMKNSDRYYYIKYFPAVIFFYFSVLFLSCANQLPPTGGDDDKTPPRVRKIIPKPNTVRFDGNSITILFDKYVDRRSFRESLFISPKPAKEPDFNWGGKEVEIKFTEPLKKNKTYTFLISKGFKDFLGNFLNEPIQFAVSTGDSIDNASISGKVFSNSYNNIIIFAYSLKDKNDTLINPLRISPDYITQVNENGSYFFNHITKSNYRVFALKDVNKNMVYDKGIDEISVLPSDIFMDTTEDIKKVNFLFNDIIPNEKYVYSSQFINTLVPDTIANIYSSIKNNEKEMPVEPRIFLLFRKNNFSKYDIADNIKLFDSTNNKFTRLVLNWTADTLLELFPAEKLKYTSEYILSIDLRNTKKNYYYKLNFMTADEKRFGKISGNVINKFLIPNTIYIKLFQKNKNVYIYSHTIESDSGFIFQNLLEGDYQLFSYIDENNNGIYDSGNPYPYSPSERFYIFESSLHLKGNWSIDNVFIRF